MKKLILIYLILINSLLFSRDYPSVWKSITGRENRDTITNLRKISKLYGADEITVMALCLALYPDYDGLFPVDQDLINRYNEATNSKITFSFANSNPDVNYNIAIPFIKSIQDSINDYRMVYFIYYNETRGRIFYPTQDIQDNFENYYKLLSGDD